MNSRVVIRQQVHVISSPPCPLCPAKLWAGIKRLPAGAGDVIQLEGSLAPFSGCAWGKYRVVFEEKTVAGERVLVCFFADYRATVYRTLSQLIANDLLGELLN